jgi:hypothetical protein
MRLIRIFVRRAAMAVVLIAVAASAHVGVGGASGDALTNERANGRALPPPVSVRPEPDGVGLGDPSFEPLPGARADFGRLGGSVYQIEVPDNWNGRLLLYMHGYGELAPTAEVSPPGIRRYLIGQGFAWGASSFSTTSLVPGRAADETAALWDFFVSRYGQPARTYVTGESMGGMAANIAAERYANRYDGALALCGSAGQTPAVSADADFFVAGAYAAGVTQREFNASTSIHTLIHSRILPALRRPRVHRRFEDIMVSLTGGPRAFDREGFRLEEETNWRRSELLVAFRLAPNRNSVYRLAPPSSVTRREFNRAVIRRLRPNGTALHRFLAGNETNGQLEMPLLTLHTTGDGQVPIEQARILRRRVDAAGRHHLLVQRVIRDPGHCGFTSTEWEAGLEALVGWVEHGVRPRGNDVLIRHLDKLRKFELNPRPGTAEADAVPGARRRVVLHGKLTLNGAPFDARFLGAIVRRRDGLITPCQLALSSVRAGRYTITVMADSEAPGCGVPGAEIALWTFVRHGILYSLGTSRWRRVGRARFDASFSSTRPSGAAAPGAQFAGEVFKPDGHQLPGGTRVEAYIGTTRCGVTSVWRTGSFSGFSLDLVRAGSVPGCVRGSTITFRVDGRPALETAANEPGRSGSLDLTVP